MSLFEEFSLYVIVGVACLIWILKKAAASPAGDKVKDAGVAWLIRKLFRGGE